MPLSRRGVFLCSAGCGIRSPGVPRRFCRPDQPRLGKTDIRIQGASYPYPNVSRALAPSLCNITLCNLPGMYGPPPCRKRKVRVTGWSAQMYSAFVGAKAPGQDGMRCAPFPISYAVSKDFCRVRVWGAPGSTVVPSPYSPADLARNRDFRSGR